jgi:hypothetical protein
VIWRFTKSIDIEVLLAPYRQVQNWSYWLPMARILRLLPMALALLVFVLSFFASPLIGIPFVFGSVVGLIVLFAAFKLIDRSRLFNPVERLVLVDRSLLVKRIAGCDHFLREHVKNMKFEPASNDDYDELQRRGQLYEATIRAKGRRVEVHCWLLITETDARALLQWLNGANENTTQRGTDVAALS